MTKTRYNKQQLNELLYQAIETKRGGIKIYEMALRCALNKDLKDEWEEHLTQTLDHQQELLGVLNDLGLNPETRSPGRDVVAHIDDALVDAIKLAQKEGTGEAAQLVAGECVVLAETKDYQNLELIEHLAKHDQGRIVNVLKATFDSVEREEQDRLYHTKGFLRELWIDSFGLPAILPPPEKVKKLDFGD